MGVLSELGRDVLEEFFLDLKNCLAWSEAGTVCDPKDVCVHGDRRMAESRVENDIGGFSAHTGQGLQ